MTLALEALEALEPAGSSISVVGPPGAGKTAFALQLERAASENGRRVLLVSPASGGLDVGATVVASVVRRLGGSVGANRAWGDLLTDAARLLSAQGSDLLVIVDEPSRWMAAEGHFGARADDVIDLLCGPSASWNSVVIDNASERTRTFLLPEASVADLRDSGAWGPLSAAAARIADQPDAWRLNTPLKQRLAVAIELWRPDSVLEEDSLQLGIELAEILAGHREGKRLWVLWQRLALARVALDEALISSLGGDRLSDLGSATLQLVLLDGGGRLHDVLRRVSDLRPAAPELQAATRGDAHRLLYAHHEAALHGLSAFDDRAASHAAEALYHAGELGDVTLTNLIRFDLTDQLDAVAQRLVLNHGDFRAARSVFRRALDANEQDTFAHHGAARAGDVLGENADEVEFAYRRALALEPAAATWHADLVTFLCHLGRIDEARSAWASAESTVVDARSPFDTYDRLHLRVATVLLAFGELAFATYVLEGVPETVREVEWNRLKQLLHARQSADEPGSFVPAPRSAGPWWTQPPQALAPRDTDGRELASWGAGRVEAVDSEGVHIHLAYVTGIEHHPLEIGTSIVSLEAWAVRCLDAPDVNNLGARRFLEIGRYRHAGLEARTAIRLLPRTRLPPARHEPLDPRRWSD